jgi:acyl phosphate:glycerol-3-phosphate acyltransferase
MAGLITMITGQDGTGGTVEILQLATVALIAYLVGSIPTGYLLARLIRGVDPRQHGSSRTGATNVFRLLGWKAAAGVLLGDLCKAVAAILAARALSGGDPTADLLAGLGVMAGHTYSAFLALRGGRGVVVGATVTVLMAPVTLLVGMAFFAATVALTRYVSLGSIVAALSMPPTLMLLVLAYGQPLQHLLFANLSAAFILYSHRDNVSRLLRGTERRLGQKLTDQAQNSD